MVIAMEYKKLKMAGATALSALDKFLLSRGYIKCFLLDQEVQGFVVECGVALWVPTGWAPLCIALADESNEEKDQKSKAVVAIWPLLHTQGLKGMEKAVALYVKQ